MQDATARGVLVISIDLELDGYERVFARQRSLCEMTDRLVKLLGRYQVEATWAVADPSVSAATDGIRGAGDHEIAVLGDEKWAGAAAGRTRFARELSRRVQGGRAAELAISSLVLRNVQLAEHLDLLVKHRITAIGGRVSRSATFTPPRAIRFGVWEVPAAARLPGNGRLVPGGGGLLSARRQLRRAARRAEIVHLAVDGARLVDAGAAGVRLVENVVRYADRQRQRGCISIETLSQLAARLSRPRQVTPSHSILRAA